MLYLIVPRSLNTQPLNNALDLFRGNKIFAAASGKPTSNQRYRDWETKIKVKNLLGKEM